MSLAINESWYCTKGRCLRSVFVAIDLILFSSCFGQNVVLPETTYYDQSRQSFIIIYPLSGIKINERIKMIPFYMLQKDTIWLKSIKGDTTWQQKKKTIQIEWDPFKDWAFNFLNLKIYLFKRKEQVKPPIINSLLFNGSNSAPLGLKAIFMLKNVPPIYLSGRMGNLPPSIRDTISNEGMMDYRLSGIYQGNTKVRLGSYALAGGVIFRFDKNWYGNAGLGFGLEQVFVKFDEYNLDYQKIGSAWALTQSTAFYKGNYYEIGLMRLQKNSLLSFGVGTIGFKVYQITAGINILFNHPFNKNRDEN